MYIHILNILNSDCSTRMITINQAHRPETRSHSH